MSAGMCSAPGRNACGVPITVSVDTRSGRRAANAAGEPCADLGRDEVRAVDAEVVHELRVVVDDDVKRHGKSRCIGVERPKPRMSGLTTLKCRARCGIQSYQTTPLSAQP